MINKEERTLDLYKQVGAEWRLYKEIRARLLVDASKVLTAPEQDKLLRACGRTDEVCSRADDHMFHDHPEVDNTYVDVFYGTLHGEPRTAVDAEVVSLARSVADSLFGE